MESVSEKSVTEISRNIEEIVQGFRACCDTYESLRRGCAICPYEGLGRDCVRRLNTDILEFLKRRVL